MGKEIVKIAYKKGYRINDEGLLLSYRGNVLKCRTNTNGYLDSNIKINGKLFHLQPHQLAAYQKFGDLIFQNDCVRHLDGNKQNNKLVNIEIGSHSDNAMDIPKHIRIERSKKALHFKFGNVDEIRDFYKICNSYKETMQRFDINSKGTLHYILNSRKYKLQNKQKIAIQ